MKRHYFSVLLLCLASTLTLSLAAQNVGINDDNSSPDANAMLDIKSTTKGALFPRMTTAQRTTLGNLNPTEGMLVFDTEVEAYFFFVNGGWVQLSTGSGSSVPVGTILAYAGHIVDDGTVIEPITGFLFCNGAVINTVLQPQYQNLENVIESYWGNGGDGLTETNNLPDLRGMFLRGVNGVRSDGKQDPGDNRDVMNSGGQSGNHVGSYQNHAVEQHTHTYTRRSTTYTAGSGGNNVWRSDASFESSGVNGAVVSSETRPKNAYVQYIIKY